ncbi:hypothetical protein B0H67DRAFT_598733 [Lasiosphaeris hirsuta]|uniref:Uncharacterized protein n=1 Tax=Lasiosphaeris hirsuta TaxID=260670 RepID=A0AA40B0N3_9PEZI|nr:hypothetical protein B0H67DRAFT_598733 [Lasiosphaeris hirsuta]
MFEAERQRILDSCTRWIPNDGQLGYIETWSYGDSHATASSHFRKGSLRDSQMNDWLQQKGEFAIPHTHDLDDATGSIRLLLCERLGWRPPGFSMSRRSFLSMEALFDLPPEALPVMTKDAGGEYSSFKYDEKGVLASMSVTVKLPQMFQLGNLGLTLTHSFKTRITLAFMYGWHVFADQNQVTGDPVFPHVHNMQETIRSSALLWTHPLLIPVVLLQEHVCRADMMLESLEPRVRWIEQDLGVTKAARLVTSTTGISPEVKELMTDEEGRMEVMTRLNTAATDVINTSKVLKWDRRYCKFLRQACEGIRSSEVHSPVDVEKGLEGFLSYLEGQVGSAADFGESMRLRLDIQLNVLYNFISHAGNELNSKIAAAAGLDSAAVKTLAFVTAVFLPPQFVAAMFSMTMFNWQTSTSNGSPEEAAGESAVTPSFWIYWAVTIPLTLFIMVGWWVWWQYQRQYYARGFPGTKQDGDTRTSQTPILSLGLKGPFVRRKKSSP